MFGKKKIALTIFTFQIFCVLSTGVQANERMVYAWQEYDPNQIEDNDKAKGFVFSQVEGESKQVVSENAIYPSISSDGQEVAFSEKQGGNYAIILKNLNTGGSEQWVAPAFNLMADLSGNGRYLAFSGPYGPEFIDRNGNSVKANQIAIIDLWAARLTESAVSPTDAKRKIYHVNPEIISSDGRAYFPELSSDGRYVVFHESFGSSESGGKKAQSKRIVLYDRHTKQSTFITGENDYCMEPTMSFDDRYIAAVCRISENGKDNDDVYLFDRLKLTNPRVRITVDPGRDYAPTFRPNQTLIFACDRGRRDKEFRLCQSIRAADGTYKETGFFVDAPGVHYVPSFSGDTNMNQNFNRSHLVEGRSSFGIADMDGTPIVIGGNRGKQHDHSVNAIVSSSEILKDGQWYQDTSLERPTQSQGFEAFYYDQKVFAVGGLVPETDDHGTYSLDKVDVYDTQKKSWTDSFQLAHPRSSFAASQIGSKAYLFYGWSSKGDFMGDYIHEGEILDLVNMKVEQEFDLPTPYRRGFASAVWKDKIILVGGFADAKFIDNVEIFDPKAIGTDQMIQKLPSLPFGTFSPTAAVVGDMLYVFGGVFPYGPSIHTDSLYVSHVYRLNLANPSAGWEHTGRYMREPKAFLRALPGKDPGTVYLVGGHSLEIGREDNLPVTTTEVWNLVNSSK